MLVNPLLPWIADMEFPEKSRPLCRPKLLPDEWIETYLFRVARANGVSSPKLSDIERFRPTLQATAGSKPQGYPVWATAAMPRWSVVTRPNRIRYCPACMVESRHIRSRWRLTMLEVCTLHHIRLKDDLAEPVMTRGHTQEDMHLITDITEDQLWDGATCPMPGERRHVARLWSDFERLILEDNTAIAFERLRYILLFEALLDALATTERDSESLPVGTPRSTRVAALVQAHRFKLAADSKGIFDFLDQIVVPEHRTAVLSRLRRMLLDESYKQTCFSALPIAELRKRFFMDWKDTSSSQSDGVRLENGEAPDGGVRLETAARMIGCSADLLWLLVRSRILQDTSAGRHERKRYAHLTPKAVEACRRWYAFIATREQAKEKLQIAQRGYVSLLRSGLLRPLPFIKHPYFQQSDLDDLCRRFETISQPCPSDISHLQSLFGEWLPCRGTYKRTSPDMLQEALRGSFPVFRRLDYPGLSAYFVDWRAIDRLHRLKRDEAANHAQKAAPVQQLSLLLE